ncbi:MAG: arginase family protein [Desulfobacterales bacterium]|nr:arginase family protein [Desulfobacterales bacterium]
MSSKDKLTMMMETSYWWGIPTFFRCPVEKDPTKCDIALVGVPHSSGNGSTLRDQHLGPRAVRNVSALARKLNNALEISPWETCDIVDAGDVPLPEALDNEKCVERITDFFLKLSNAGVNPVSMGGDHGITGGILQGIAGEKANLTNGKKAAILHFDAHLDSYHHLEHWMGAKKSAAHWASYLVRNGHVDAKKSVQIGIRGNTRTWDWLEPSYELGYEVLTKKRCEEIGIEACIDIINRRIGDAPLYVTFDLDCLDPSVAPGVSNPEPAFDGFRMNEVMKVLHSMKGKNVIGGDVVCLMPTIDSPNNITAYVATAIMFEILSLVAFNKKKDE